jgi:predicted acylesterase/phospholipase RssA
MRILVLPVSGGGFVSQLAILEHLCESHFIPDLTLASSGGNVAAYIAAAANWKWAGIERIARELSQSLFARPWNSVMSISMIIGYFKGDVYNKGDGVNDFLSRYFTSTTIKKYEIWTGTYNKNRQKARLFCNRSKETSIVDVSCIDHDLTQSMDSFFANGDISIISQAGIASASIPAIVPAQNIMGEDYVDGGVAGASPLTIMQEPILKHTRETNSPLHLVYVNSIDLSSPDIKPIHNVFDTWRQATKNLIRSQTVIDRLSGYELFRCNPGTITKEEFPCNYDNMERIKKIQSRVKYSILEIYPTSNFDVELVKFNGDDVIHAIRTAYQNCKCRFWWMTPDDTICDPEICSLINECKNC